jgi:MarR family transcriptional regulator for hemolysin
MSLKREASAGYMTNWAARLFLRELERQLAPTGIAPAYMPVLFALADGSKLTQKELARRAAVEQPTMAATLNRMQRDALIARMPDPADRRSALIALTPLALGKVTTVEQVVAAINAKALAPLNDSERAQYFALLGKVISVLEAQDHGLSG